MVRKMRETLNSLISGLITLDNRLSSYINDSFYMVSEVNMFRDRIRTMEEHVMEVGKLVLITSEYEELRRAQVDIHNRKEVLIR